MKIFQTLGVYLAVLALTVNFIFFSMMTISSEAGFIFWGISVFPLFVLSSVFSINSSSKLLNEEVRKKSEINTNYWKVILWLNRVLSIVYISFFVWVVYIILARAFIGN